MNLVPLEGARLIEEAFYSKIQFNYVLVVEGFQDRSPHLISLVNTLTQAGVDCYEVETSLLDKTAFTETPQGILGTCYFHETGLDDMVSTGRDLLVLHQIQDPGNLGTLIRSADAFGFGGVICCKGCADVTNDKVIRSSMGTIFHLPVKMAEDHEVAYLVQAGYKILMADPASPQLLSELKITGPVALMIGNEAHGFKDYPSNAISNGDYYTARIPMFGKVESLNAGIAGSIIMYALSIRGCN